MANVDPGGHGLEDGLSEAVLRAADVARLGVAVTLMEPNGPRNVFLSDAAVSILGFPREELMVRPAMSNLAPEERDRLGAIARSRAPGDQDASRVETVIIQKDGRRVPIVSVASRLTVGGVPATVSFFWDISDRKAAEEVRRVEADRLARLLAEAPDGILILRGPSILLANRAAARLVGVADPSQLVGRSLAEIVVREDLALMQDRLMRRAKGEALGPQEYRTVRPDGSIAVAEITSIPFEYDGAAVLLAFARDVTERVALREQLASAERLAAVGTLAAGIAHEINNPLMAASLQVDLLGRLHPGDVGFSEAIDELQRMHTRIAFVVRDLKAFARSDDGERTAVDLVSVVATVNRMLASAFKGKGFPIVDLAGLPPVVGTVFRLEQVFLNLILNALQALPEGSLDNRLELRGYRVGQDRVCVEVIDNGGGIAPDDMERLFRPFFTTKPVGVGTGLGLPVCRDIVTRLGGDVEVSSVLGRGTTVRVYLVVASETAEAQTAPSIAVRRQRRRVVVIDDEALLAETLGILLGARNDVEVYTEAERALERLLTDAPFDVVLCDLMMPGYSGMELFRRVAAKHSDYARRFVFMTGGAYTAAATEFMEQTKGRHLLKPFDVATVEALFAELGV